ncbi:MAG: putative thiosulfate sulfurtransferase [Syntrophaceae bacterium PtaU1.Bin231]|nr:MAG: putative thiosulfate sulfurtransferase [Syntrophaceae bacterium PtaU1.Bin231]HOG17933.1 sulfurtransferase [Syntrophales bacterium]
MMRKNKSKWLAMTVGIVLLMSLACLSFAADIEPVVTTDWLGQNLDKVVVLDIRKVEEYRAGHIPGAINVVYDSWAVKKGDLLNELPADDDLRDIISSTGIEATSSVVVVGKTDTMTDKVNATRIAFTLKYAGVADVAVLSGGYNKWAADKKTVSTEAVRPRSKAFTGKFQKDLVVKKNDVLAAIGKAVIVDTRDPDTFAGKKKLDFVAKAGHIKGAVLLETTALYEADGTYKPKEAIAALAAGVVGTDTSKEIIVYCDSGRVATAWWFMLHEVLGYKNAKLYDGSMMDYAKDPAAPMEP